ncbi:glycine betaine/proline transport system substrate-binding protein [Evansella vedderi]|uniref:Glycine betaine/proline transport system substrate-binding protein n=1 Tax=Evansella vedderi TaxID=38282 RepID=A0ABT9ZX01_9BACI|nr:glycine betaine ABC transporter substrate-binding protein [Evansella vedderi]MDQ0255757.1 glycine betaine/proline transport system substrate-binding protein [Evansella vedderi]
MKKRISFFFSIILLIGIVACGPPTDGGGTTDTTDGDVNRDITITMGLTNWTSTIPPTYIAKEILEDLGYTVELQPADPGMVFTGLHRGDIDVFMDAWLPDMHANFMERYGENIDDVAVSYTEGEMGWVIPDYVDESIQTVSDIRGNEHLFDNQIFGIEEGAGMTDSGRAMIEAYDLDLTYVASSEPGMLTEARRHISNEEPVLFLGWRPHPMFADWDLRVLEEDEEEFHPTSQVHILTTSGLDERAPEVYNFFSNWSIPINDVEEMIVKYDEGMSEEELAREWIEENQDRVQEMLGGTS